MGIYSPSLEGSAPSSPAAGFSTLYPVSVTWYYKTAAGNVKTLVNLEDNQTFTGTLTLGAITLGGTVSGGGNQINNVVIGAVTPLAGAFTSITASTTLGVTGASRLDGGLGIGVAADATNYINVSASVNPNMVALLTNTNATDGAGVQYRMVNNNGDAAGFKLFSSTTTNSNYQGPSATNIFSVAGTLDLITIGAKAIRLWVNNTTQAMNVSSVGAMQFNTYGAGAATFDASGNITSVSDERSKRNIRAFSRSTEALLGLRPILHGYTPESGLDQSRDDYAGFSAQNVQRFIPEAVGQMQDGKLTLNDRPITAALVNAFQELSARLAKLEQAFAIIEAQKREIDELKKQKDVTE
jgi:hypothetical protein